MASDRPEELATGLGVGLGVLVGEAVGVAVDDRPEVAVGAGVWVGGVVAVGGSGGSEVDVGVSDGVEVDVGDAVGGAVAVGRAVRVAVGVALPVGASVDVAGGAVSVGVGVAVRAVTCTVVLALAESAAPRTVWLPAADPDGTVNWVLNDPLPWVRVVGMPAVDPSQERTTVTRLGKFEPDTVVSVPCALFDGLTVSIGAAEDAPRALATGDAAMTRPKVTSGAHPAPRRSNARKKCMRQDPFWEPRWASSGSDAQAWSHFGSPAVMPLLGG